MVGAIVAIAVEEALKKENHQSLLIISVRSDSACQKSPFGLFRQATFRIAK